MNKEQWAQLAGDMTEPPIQLTLGFTLVARLYQQGGDRRELARKHLRRRYREGVQLAFCYWEEQSNHVWALKRLARFMAEDDAAEV